MIYTVRYIFALLALMQATLFISCESGKKQSDAAKPKIGEGVVAVVGTSVLTAEDLQQMIPPKLRGQDSLVFIKSALHAWVKNELLYNYALEQNAFDDSELQKKMEEFKKEWIVHSFESEFYKSKADTGYTDKELMKYYELHKQDFHLTEYIWKGYFVTLPEGSKVADKAEKLLLKSDEKSLTELANICTKSSFDYQLSTDRWLPVKLITQKTPEWSSLLQPAAGRLYKSADADYVYLWKPTAVLASGDVAPYAFLKERIKTILIHKDRIKTIDELQEKLYNESLKKNEIEIADI